MVRGVIDNLDEDWALLVLDDGQRLYWPRERLPEGTKAGMAVVLDLEHGPSATEQLAAGIWNGKIEAATQEEGNRPGIRLGDQTLVWTGRYDAAKVGQVVTVRMAVDLQDTERRRKKVQALLDELFAT